MSSGAPTSAPRPTLLSRLRLRHKIAALLIVAAIVPVLSASSIAVRLVIDALRAGMHAQTERTMRVALNLLLTQVKEVFDDTVRFSELPELPVDLASTPATAAMISDLLQRREVQLPPGLIQVADAQGRVVARRAVGGSAHLSELEVEAGADSIRRALGYERRVTLVEAGRWLVVRASVPVVDSRYELAGVVVASVPLDAEFADRLKAQLSADVAFYRGMKPSSSSFMTWDGRRETGFALPPEVMARVLEGHTATLEMRALGRSLFVGLAPLQDLDGKRLGVLAVTVDEEELVAARAQAWRSLLLGGLFAASFALLVAGVLSRRLTTPLRHLHQGALAVARGDLEQPIIRETGDEIGDLAVAFSAMTRAVKENQERLAARVREIVTLQEIGRAVSSVLGLDEVLRKIVEEVAGVLAADRCVLLLQKAGAPFGGLYPAAGVGLEGAELIAALGEILARRGGPVRIDDAQALPELALAAQNAGVSGSVLAVPLEQKDHVLGVLLVNRRLGRFGDADLRLVATFATQAATAISNARLYDEVQKSSEELELKVKERTFELVVANQELGHALDDLRMAQAQVVHSERMAGLGQLVAGVAHEVNSPAAAIQGTVDNLGENVQRLARRAREIGELPLTAEERTRFFTLVEQLAPTLSAARVEPPAQVRRRSRELAEKLTELGMQNPGEACRLLVEVGAAEAAYQLAQLAGRRGATAAPPSPAERTHAFATLVGYVEEYAYLVRSTVAIRTAIRRITRIVGALKGYTHLDQAKVTTSDLHEGIENTLVILHPELKYGINLTRKFGELPQIPIYVDELNQVWTNLIHNAVQALRGRGEIVIETRLEQTEVVVVVQDDGPGIPPDVMPNIFEPFFTTKPKGEGTGLGLGIVRQIVEKHGGRIDVESRPGQTRFIVRLPVAGPPPPAEAVSAPPGLH